MSTISSRSNRSHSYNWNLRSSWHIVPDVLHFRRSRHNSAASDDSSNTSGHKVPTQVIAGARVDEAKLQRLLDDKFDGNYTLHVRAPRNVDRDRWHQRRAFSVSAALAF